jgi:hypothetical protein
MMDRLRVNNVHAKAPVDLTEGERAEAAKLYRLWTGHYFPHLEAWVRDTQTAKTPVNFMEWLHNWCRLMNHCAEQRRFALQAGFFTESPVRNSGKGSTNSSTSANNPKQGNNASKKRNAPEPAPKRGQGGTSNADRSLCEGCGKSHVKGLSLAQIGKGHTSDCQFHRHPDFNKSGKPWKESTIGKALATQPEGYQSLSHNYQLVNGVWQRVKVNKVKDLYHLDTSYQISNIDNVIDRNLSPQSEDSDGQRLENFTCIMNECSHMLNDSDENTNLSIFKFNLINSFKIEPTIKDKTNSVSYCKLSEPFKIDQPFKIEPTI